MNFFISVVSHDHHHIIKSLDSLSKLTRHDKVTVICRDNIPNAVCREYCLSNGVHYCANNKVEGFAANNNANYLYAKEQLGMQAEDYFVLMNPDVFIDQKNIKKLLDTLRKQQPKIAAPCLYINKKQTVYDDNLRKYPRFKNFVKNYILRDRSTVIDKKTDEPERLTYWVSGSFMCVRSKIYETLEGFDETYYMYCEDVDFCARALRKGYQTSYIPEVVAVHYRRCSSRKFLSRPFFWHVKSVFWYSLASNHLRRHKSTLMLNKAGNKPVGLGNAPSIGLVPVSQASPTTKPSVSKVTSITQGVSAAQREPECPAQQNVVEVYHKLPQ
jgi:GT2 family glycosyltransferase